MKVAVLIDGGYLRVLVRKQSVQYTPDYIEKVALACIESNEALLKVLYYDCPPYPNPIFKPISNQPLAPQNGQWLIDLSCKDYFAVRRGILKFRGFKLKQSSYGKASLQDSDFNADFEQKGVDMRIGLDIATLSQARSVDRVILLTGDTDCVPAMKLARRSGIQVVLMDFPGSNLSSELLPHVDFRRSVQWP